MTKSTSRAVNWDLLRSLAMFLVVVVHTSALLGPIHGIGTSTIIRRFAFICDPVFFALSGYFALRPSKRGLKEYYLNKVSTILLPLFVYSILLYLFLTKLKGMSLNGYFTFFLDQLKGGWWFIPTLIPCLVAAPFLAKGLEALSNKMVAAATIVFGILFGWGALCSFSSWLFSTADINTLVSLSDLMAWLVPPSVLYYNPVYFEFFLLGGLFMRLEASISHRQSICLVVLGIACWVADIVFAEFGLPRSDPSYFWLFATFGIFIIFSHLAIKSDGLSKVISWIAQRSYSIYLLQFTTIALLSSRVYDIGIFGDIYNMGAFYRVGAWLFVTFGAYVFALAVASVVDPLVLKNAQKAFSRAFIERESPKD